jgi:hypothetical protein
MKRLIILILICVVAVQLFAQQQQNFPITGINLIVPAILDANIASWGTGTSFISISATTKLDPRGEIPAAVKESKILVTIKSGDSKVVRGIYTSFNAPASNFTKTPMSWSGPNVVSLLGENRPLDPGNYSFCVHFFQPAKPGSAPQECYNEVCRPFTVRGTDKLAYQPPQAVSPADGTVIKEADAKKPVTFRWTPVIPKPKENVTYKLRIFEIRQGQAATAAAKSVGPLLEKVVTNQTEFVLPSLSQLTIAKGSSYGWYVQATNPEGTPVGGNNGMSNVCTLRLDIGAIQLLGFQVYCGNTPGSYNYTFNVQNNSTSSFEITYVSFSPAVSGIVLSPPVPPSQTIAINGNLNFNGTFNYSGVIPNPIIISVSGNQSGLPALTSARDTIPPCLCIDCDSLIWNFNLNAHKISNDQYDLTGSLGVNLPIYGVEFQVQSWSFAPIPTACSNGVTNLEESGMILLPATTINNTAAIQVFNENISGSNFTNNHATKAVKLLSITPMPNPIPINLTIGLPGALPGLSPNCCAIRYKVCIKATVFYDAELCKSCTKIKCFEFTNQ